MGGEGVETRLQRRLGSETPTVVPGNLLVSICHITGKSYPATKREYSSIPVGNQTKKNIFGLRDVPIGACCLGKKGEETRGQHKTTTHKNHGMLANAGKCRPPHIIRGCHSHDSIEAGSTLTRANCDHSPMRSTAICLIQSISHLEHQKRQSPFSLSLIDRYQTSWRRFKSLHAQWREEEGRLSFTNSFSV